MSCPRLALLFMPSSKDIWTINKIISKYKIPGIRTLWKWAGGSASVFPTAFPAHWAHVKAGLWQVTDMHMRVTLAFWWCSFWPWLALRSRRSSGSHWWEQGWRLKSCILFQALGWFAVQPDTAPSYSSSLAAPAPAACHLYFQVRGAKWNKVKHTYQLPLLQGQKQSSLPPKRRLLGLDVPMTSKLAVYSSTSFATLGPVPEYEKAHFNKSLGDFQISIFGFSCWGHLRRGLGGRI